MINSLNAGVSAAFIGAAKGSIIATAAYSAVSAYVLYNGPFATHKLGVFDFDSIQVFDYAPRVFNVCIVVGALIGVMAELRKVAIERFRP